jgi:DNA-binding FadR family transcriptional regulator
VSLRDVTEVWDDLEILVAGLAAHRRTAKQARQLLELSEPLDPKITDAAYIFRGTSFHQLVNAAAGNPFLEMLLNPIGHLAREVFTPLGHRRREFFNRTNDEHRILAQAIADRDADLAMRLMKEHNRYRATAPASAVGS